MTQSVAVVKEEPQIVSSSQPDKIEKKKEPSLQEMVDSLKSIADDIGQISELSSEEKILVSQFFISLLKLMTPLAPSIVVSQTALPSGHANVSKAYIDTTGNLVLLYEDGRLEVENLKEQRNRDLMTAVIGDVLPKFKNLTSQHKRKIENRIKLLSNVTKEIQKSSEALAVVFAADK